MSANIFGSRFLGARNPAWHGLGTVIDDPITAHEAVARCGLDYNVVKLPLTGHVETPFGTQLVQVPDKVMIVREPTVDDPEYRYFGVASPDYGIIQNSEVAAALDRLTTEWPVETVGALGKGETIFFTLDCGLVDVHGEQIHEYFLVTDTKDGGTSLKIAYTPVRVVCQNTLVSGLKQSVISASLDHRASIGGDFNFRVGLVEQMNKAKNETKVVFELLASASLGDTGLEYILERAYPLPNKPKKVQLLESQFTEADITALGALYTEASEANALWEYYIERAKGFRLAAKSLYENICAEYPDVSGTPWAAYNAVVESADFRRGADDTSISASALFGPRAQEKIRAFKAACDVALI